MAFRVEITEEAERDAHGILDWLISQQAGETGLRWFLGLEKAIASLATFPGRCPLAPESEAFSFEIRHLLYGRRPHVYRVVFTVESETVYVLHIWHGRRKPISKH
jgi:plasmid stabilization system protein ParE